MKPTIPDAARAGAWLLLASFLLLGTAAAVAQQEGTAASTGPAVRPATPEDPQHAFDWELGSWTVRLSRLASPLTGSDEWVDYEGTSVVRPVWGGAANLGELDVAGPGGRIVGMSLRLYDPGSRQWRIHWASRADGLIGEAMVGGFAAGRGEFYNYEPFGGRVVLVRFVFSDMTDRSFRFEQSFSDDHGRSWEPNWVAEFSRLGEPGESHPGR